MMRVARWGRWAGISLAILAPVAALMLTHLFARDVILLAPAFAPDIVEANRALHEPGDAVASLYGIASPPVRVVFADPSRILHPEEDRSLTLLKVDKERGENPLQVRTVWFFTPFVSLGGLVLSAAAHALLRARKKSS